MICHFLIQHLYVHTKINSKNLKGRKGRQRQNLYDVLIKNPTSVNLGVESSREAAKDSKKRKNLKHNKKYFRKLERLSNKT